MDDAYLDLEVDGKTFRFTKEALQGWADAGAASQENFAALGLVVVTFAGIDRVVDRLFEPLLQCSREHVACIIVENVSTRCSQLIRLLHLETKLRADFRNWTEQLLNRVSGELAGERNRYQHDSWRFTYAPNQQSMVRVDKRPRLGKPQSRKPKTVTFEHATEEDLPRIFNLIDRMQTVSFALTVALRSLETWRQTGRLPRLHQQWIPASRPKALGRWDESWSAELRQPPPPSRYEPL